MRRSPDSPKDLAKKLLAIRRDIKATQERMAQLLDLNMSAARISGYETGKRVPDLLVVLRYARVAGVPMETLVDDKLKLPL